MKKIALFLISTLLVYPLSGQVAISLTSIASGLTKPVDIAHCGDDRLFIVEQDGVIRIIDGTGTLLPTPFLDIKNIVGSAQNERGLLGLAFHPDYLNNGYFYLNYTKETNGDTRVSRFSVSGSDPNIADPSSEVVLFEVNQPYSNHNGGCLKFGPDGYLYASLGDGGSGGDPLNSGQTRITFLGKMLRIDVDNGTPYGIPPGNPFINDPTTEDEIWALGLRNPWRFSFDRVTGDMWIGDVGQNNWEEIDFQPASSEGGINYGWRCYEGNHAYNTGGCVPMSQLTFPVFEYQNSFAVGCSVTGGFVYRGCDFPGLYGHYLFADYCSGRFWSIVPDGPGNWSATEIDNLANNQFAAFGENRDGELFVAAHASGIIYRITSASPWIEKTDESCLEAHDGAIRITIPTQLLTINWSDGFTGSERTGLAPGMYSLTLTTPNGCQFTTSTEVLAGAAIPDQPVVTIDQDSILSTDPGATTYQWVLDGEPIPGANNDTYLATISGDYQVIVTNDAGCESISAVVSITITSLEETIGFDRIVITPNPFEDHLTIRLSSNAPGMAFEWTFTDAQGRTLESGHSILSLDHRQELHTGNLPAGVYFLNLKTEKGEWTGKLVHR